MKLKLILYLLLFCCSFVFSGNPHKTSSVLSTGKWYKIAVKETGIYKITYDDFKAMGFDTANLTTSTIRVFGNGAGMLPENNAGFRFDDLRENAIVVPDRSDHKLHPGDSILFYGEAPDKWSYNYTTRLYSHSKNLYSDSTYYFINVGLEQGKRVSIKNLVNDLPNTYCRRFDDFTFHEIDSLNLIKSGRTWYGEVFNDKKSSYNFHFEFPFIDTLSPIRMVTSVAARSAILSKFYIEYKGRIKDSVQVDFTDLQSTSLFAKPKQKITNLTLPPSNVDLTIDYIIPDGNSIGWLDYIELICARNLHWVSPQMSFRDANTIGKSNLTEFIMADANPSVTVWDVTDKENIREIKDTLSNNILKFRLLTDTLHEFIAFDKSFFYKVRLVGPIANQNLHSLDSKDLIIVTHPLFKDQADSLATFHREQTSLTVAVVTTTDIYNEFASGNSDLTAIRDFMKMLYDRAATGSRPRYLLLFGDGSYDPKNRVNANNNMVPTYQSVESLKFIGTYVTDDYYGIMGDNQGEGSNGTINIGIGRFPVTLRSDASILLKKILSYSSKKDSVMSDWRNVITFIADDENRNLHMIQAEELAGIVKTNYPVFNVDKIYLDAYQMIQVPAGSRFPDVNKAINHAVAKGSLIINYTGHGGEDGWAGEKVLTIADIKSWKNSEKLPVFITATCEFSRFDNPERYTAGEMVLLQPDGGAIALYSTTRLALSTSNFRLDSSFFLNLLPAPGNPIPKMGDLIRISKNNNTNNNNIRNFVLLGDPAQTIAYPEYNVITTEINQKTVDEIPDTALGLSKVSVKGEVVDLAGNKLNHFNGTLFPKVFDKPSIGRTLGNTDDSYPQNFELQRSVIYKGKSGITNGDFEFSFMVPKSIALQFGKGKISYYAKDSVTDGWGYFDNIIVGGEDPLVNPVDSGPEMSLYMDNTDFINGGKTGSDPMFIAKVTDPDGINYTNVGIGHEIIAILDNDETHPIVLNDFYYPDVDHFESGEVRSPMQNLTNGRHTIRMKAWDLYDNSSEKEIYFYVDEYPMMAVNQVGNYPNPFNPSKESTFFRFTPLQGEATVSAEIRIYNQNGSLVRTINSAFTDKSQGVLTIPWDGTGNNGALLSDGLYVYHLTVIGRNGAQFQTSQKLMIYH